MPYALYYATTPPPDDLSQQLVDRLVPVHFSSEQDAVHAAALVLRGGQHVWLIEGPGVRLTASEIAQRCKRTLEIFDRGGPKKP